VDNLAPTVPSGLTATGSKRKIALSWTASTDNVGVTGYRVFRSASAAGPFSQIATATSTTYTDIGLASGATWYYYVQATDAAGNVSAASNTASAMAK
jgi:fibronectin type 3 domain-containing protein